MTVAQSEFVRQFILDHAVCNGDTGPYGVVMPDGHHYHGPVWKFDRQLYVLYHNKPFAVTYFTDRFFVK